MAAATPSKRSATDTGIDAREAILQAAITILQQEGAGALTVRSVAAAAGCSTTGVYTWFGGKNGLVDAIFIDGFQRFGAAVTAADTAAAEPLEALERQAHAYRNWALDNPTHYMVMFGRAVPDYVTSDAARLASFATFEPLVQRAAEAIAEGKLAGNPFDTARHLWAVIHGYVSIQIAGMDMADSAEQQLRRYEEGLRLTILGCMP